MGLKKRLFMVLILLVFFALVASPVCAADSGPKKHVLVLNSYHKGLSWTDNIVKGVESVLQPESRNLEMSFEYMDTKRYDSEPYLRTLYETYNAKYSKEHFDVIIACDNDALKFITKHRKDLFVDTP